MKEDARKQTAINVVLESSIVYINFKTNRCTDILVFTR